MTTECWMFEEPWDEFVILHFADILLLERALPGPDPQLHGAALGAVCIRGRVGLIQCHDYASFFPRTVMIVIVKSALLYAAPQNCEAMI